MSSRDACGPVIAVQQLLPTRIDLAPDLARSVGMLERSANPASRSPHAASGRLLFLVSIAVGLYRA